MIRPSPRAVLVFAAGVPLALFMVIHDPGLWSLTFNYGAVVAIVALADAAMVVQARQLDVKTRAPARLHVGEAGALDVEITAPRARRSVRIELLADRRGEIEDEPSVFVALAIGAPTRIALSLRPRRRGRISIDRLWLRWRGPLGLVVITKEVAVDRAVDVVPDVRALQATALQFFERDALFGIKIQQHKGEGAEFEALRDYAPGLDSRTIDWKHSARHRKLVCREFKAERNHHVILAFDTGYLMTEPVDGLPRLDHAINAGLLLGWISLRGGDLVGTYGFDAAVRHYAQPVRGVSAFQRLQRSTAELDYQHEETNFTLGLAELNARLKRRALVVVFTDFVDTVTAELLVESLRRIANRHAVIFVSLRDSAMQRTIDAAPERFDNVAQAVVANDLLRDRAIVFERLERIGIHCLDIASKALPIALVNRYLHVKQRGLL